MSDNPEKNPSSVEPDTPGSPTEPVEDSGKQPEPSDQQKDTEESDSTGSSEDLFKGFKGEDRDKNIKEFVQGLGVANVYIDARSGGAYFAGNVHARDVIGRNQTRSTAATGEKVAGQVLIADIKKVRTVYVQTNSYTRAQEFLEENHLLILWGNSHSGKRTTAIHLLLSLVETNDIFEIDPTIQEKDFKEFECQAKQVYVIDTLAPDSADKLNSYVLNGLSQKLRKQHSYMVITIDNRASKFHEALGEYTIHWNEIPAGGTMLEKHLAWYIQDEEIIANSHDLTKATPVRELLSNKLLPGDVDRLAKQLGKVLSNELTLEDALAFFGGRVREQVESWFEKHQDMTEYVFMIALAVLNRSKYKAVVDASQRLQLIINPPSEKEKSSDSEVVFNRKRSQWLKEVYAYLTYGYENTEYGHSPVELIVLDNPEFQREVLSYVWNEYDLLRDSILLWLHDLGSYPNFEVKIRVAAAVGELSKYDFRLVCDRVLRPWAKCKEPQVQRLAALALSVPVCESDLVPQVLGLLHHWSTINNSQLHWTTTVAYGGYVGWRFPDTALRDLFEIAESGDKSLYSAVAESVVTLFNAARHYLIVLNTLHRWTDQPKRTIAHQLGLLIFWDLMRGAKVQVDATKGDWPTLLWLVKEDQKYVKEDQKYEKVVICLLRRALNRKLTRVRVLEEIRKWLEIVDGERQLYKVLGLIIFRLAAEGTEGERDRILLYLTRWTSTRQLKAASDILSVIKKNLNIQ